MARESVCDKDYDENTMEATFDFNDGTKLVLEVGKLAPHIQAQLTLHGAIQKIGDSFAGAKGNVAEAISRAKEVLDALKAGNWGPEREGGMRIGLLAEAISRIQTKAGKHVSVEDARAALSLKDGATDEEKKALQAKISQLRSHPQVKLVVAQIQMERAQEEAKSAPELTL